MCVCVLCRRKTGRFVRCMLKIALLDADWKVSSLVVVGNVNELSRNKRGVGQSMIATGSSVSNQACVVQVSFLLRITKTVKQAKVELKYVQGAGIVKYKGKRPSELPV